MICAESEHHSLSLGLVRLSPLQGMPSSSFSFLWWARLLGNTLLLSLRHRNISGFFTAPPTPFRTDHSLLGCLPLSTRLSSLHRSPPMSSRFPGFILNLPSWIHSLLGCAGHCHQDWIIPLTLLCLHPPPPSSLFWTTWSSRQIFLKHTLHQDASA